MSLTERWDPGVLRDCLASVPPGSWSLPSTYEGTGVHHGYRRVVLVEAGQQRPAAVAFAPVLARFTPVRGAWLSWIDPGGFIAPHRDGAPWFERWQVPVQASGLFDDHRPTDGQPFLVQQWLPHAVWNDGDQPRIHVVIDRDLPVVAPPEPFAKFPIPPERAYMVERVTKERT